MPSDARATAAREAHRRASEAMVLARHHRSRRDRQIRALRKENPEYWTYTALAKAVGCSPELVAAVVQERVRKDQKPRGNTHTSRSET